MYAHYALLKLNMLPSTFNNLPQKEKAFVVASIELMIESEQRQKQKIEEMRG